jgi:hypothetical protein
MAMGKWCLPEMVPAHPFVRFYIWKLVEQQQIAHQEKWNQGCHK